MTEPGNLSFSFLFRTDKGRIGRDAWWRGTVPMVVIAAAATAGWSLLSPYAVADENQVIQHPNAAFAAYLYLLVYMFGLLLIAICEYNLSAKRFRARGRPSALAGILPLTVLCGAAVMWLIPRSFGGVPPWAAVVVLVAVLAVTAWNIVELGLLDGDGR